MSTSKRLNPSSNGHSHSMDLIVANQLERVLSANNYRDSISSMSRLWARGPTGIDDDNLDWRRNYNTQCGFPLTGEVNGFAYRSLFDREAVANRVVTILPRACWAAQPAIYEDEDAKTQTPFEQGWDQLCKKLRNDSWFQDEEGNPVFEHLCRGDILSGIGSFGIILLGFNDGRELEQPVAGYGPDTGVTQGTDTQYLGVELSPPVSPYITPQGDLTKKTEDTTDEISPIAGSGTSPEDIGEGLQGEVDEPPQQGIELLFMRSFDESLVQIVQYEADKNNPRFGQPVMYLVTLSDPRTQHHGGIGLSLAQVRVHWTRVIHLADNLISSEVFGNPRMQPVLNNIINIQKLSGAGPEAAWLGAFMALSYETNPQLGGDVKVDIDSVAEASSRYFNDSQRFLVGEGMSIKTIAPEVVDLSAQIENQINLICIQLEVPLRLFMGSEQGELASGQDSGNWVGRLKFRQQNYVTPRIIIPFIDRMITVGVLPAPKTGYSVKWPELETVDPKDAAAVATAVTNAIASYVSGGCDVLIGPMDFLTHILGPNLGLDEEVVDEIMKNALKHLQEANPDVDPEDIVHGREPEPEVDPNSAEGMAASGVPMPPMIPGKNGNPPEPYEAPQGPRDKTGKVSVKNALASFMTKVRSFNKVMNAHDVSGEARDDHGRWMGGEGTASSGDYGGRVQERYEETKRKWAAEGTKWSQSNPHGEYPIPPRPPVHPQYVKPPKSIRNDPAKVHKFNQDQYQAFKEIEKAAKEANAALDSSMATKVRDWQRSEERLHREHREQQQTDKAIHLSKKFLDAAFAEYGKRAEKITKDAEKKLTDALAPKPSRGKEPEPKVLVSGFVGQKHRPYSQAVSKSKVEDFIKSQRFHPGYTVTPTSVSAAAKLVDETPELVKAKKELRRHIAKHVVATLAAGWAGTKAVSRDAFEAALATSGKWVFEQGLKHVGGRLLGNEYGDDEHPITNEEYEEMGRSDKLITNLALVVYPYMLSYVMNNWEKWDEEHSHSVAAMGHSQKAQAAEHTESAWDSAGLHEQAADAHDVAAESDPSSSNRDFHAKVATAHRVRAKALRTAHREAVARAIPHEALKGMNETYDGLDPIDAAIGVTKGVIRGIYNEQGELVSVENYDSSNNTEDEDAVD